MKEYFKKTLTLDVIRRITKVNTTLDRSLEAAIENLKANKAALGNGASGIRTYALAREVEWSL